MECDESHRILAVVGIVNSVPVSALYSLKFDLYEKPLLPMKMYLNSISDAPCGQNYWFLSWFRKSEIASVVRVLLYSSCLIVYSPVARLLYSWKLGSNVEPLWKLKNINDVFVFHCRDLLTGAPCNYVCIVESLSGSFLWNALPGTTTVFLVIDVPQNAAFSCRICQNVVFLFGMESVRQEQVYSREDDFFSSSLRFSWL